MEKKYKKAFVEMVNRYGIKDVEKMTELCSGLLTYLESSYERYGEIPLYYDAEDRQIITNGATSIFYLHNNDLELDLLKYSSTPTIEVSEEKIQKYLLLGRDLLGHVTTTTNLINDKGYIYYKKFKDETEVMSYEDFQLLYLLLENPTIKVSVNKPVVYAESDKGHAYIMANRNGLQYRL